MKPQKWTEDEAKPGYLYRHWSTTGTLLYIGISLNAVARLAQHKDKSWFPRIATITVERFETYAEAEVAELRAICYEGPIHNVVGPRDAKDLGPALARLRARQRRAGMIPLRTPRQAAPEQVDTRKPKPWPQEDLDADAAYYASRRKSKQVGV